MRGLAYVLVVVIPLSAVVTIALAVRPGRPRPFQSWSSGQIQDRLRELDTGQPPSRETRAERRGLQEELFRRGRGH